MKTQQYSVPQTRHTQKPPILPTVLVPKEIQRIDLLKFCTLTDLTDGIKEKTCGELTRYHFGERLKN